MGRVEARNRAAQPGAGARAQMRGRAFEIGLVLEARAARLVEKLYLRDEVRNLIRIVLDEEIQRIANRSVAPEDPLTVLGLIEQQLEDPLIGAKRSTPEGMDVRSRCTALQAIQPPGHRFEEFEAGHAGNHIRGVPSQDADIEILMGAGCSSEKQIQGPSAGNPPAVCDRGKERAGCARMGLSPGSRRRAVNLWHFGAAA